MPADYHVLAEQHGFRWLGPEVFLTSSKTIWECRHGHKWEARYNDILQGYGCPFCSGKAPKVSADYHALAEKLDLHWLGPEVPNVRTQTTWECRHGHKWEARYNDIQQGHGCPFCVGKARKTPEDYHVLAQEHGFQWLGPEVSNIRTKTMWRCEHGHCWKACYNDIHQGCGCPICAVERRAEKLKLKPADYAALAEERRFHWLGLEVSNVNSKTTWECAKGHHWEATYGSIKQGNGCPICGCRVPKTPADYHALAKSRGFRWLGPEVPTTQTNTRWECEQGHHWEAPYGNIQQGHGCLVCAGKAQKTPTDYRSLAKMRGFRWLGPEVSSIHTKTNWECAVGHQWEAPYHNIQQGGGCPVCVDMVHGARVSQIQRELCEMLGGELNHPCGSYKIDVALHVDGTTIAVEYDAWYWHGDRQKPDAKRDSVLIKAGWRVLRVRSNMSLPTREQLDAAVARLLAGENQVEMCWMTGV
jgi:very-short-patch-repair endonuclease